MNNFNQTDIFYRMNTDIGGFLFGDQFLQFVTKVPSTYVYGFGEHKKDKFRHTFDYRTYPLWARDQGPGGVCHTKINSVFIIFYLECNYLALL